MTTIKHAIVSAAGQYLGSHSAANVADALDAMARDAGYEDRLDAERTVGPFSGSVYYRDSIVQRVVADHRGPGAGAGYIDAEDVPRDVAEALGVVVDVATSWRDVPLYWLDGGKELTDAQRIVALREYRETGGMAGVVMADPSEYDTYDERLCDAGPSVDEIDWTDFEDYEHGPARVRRSGYTLIIDDGGNVDAAVALDDEDDGEGLLHGGPAALKYLPATMHGTCSLKDALALVGARIEV